MAKVKKEAPKLKSTQSFLKIADIKSDTLILEDGRLVAVMGVSSTNFALKSQEEQNALVFGYQNFLNSLDFDIQILIQSRKMDIHSYLENLKKTMEQQTNELLRLQTSEYIDFVSKLIENASIMNKNFYILVPFMGDVIKKASGGLFGFFKHKDTAEEALAKQRNFLENKLKLEQRMNTVAAGLGALGLKSIPLSTEEVIELLYYSYNFDSAPLLNAGKLGEIKLDQPQ